jgi:hypothetical protein
MGILSIVLGIFKGFPIVSHILGVLKPSASQSNKRDNWTVIVLLCFGAFIAFKLYATWSALVAGSKNYVQEKIAYSKATDTIEKLQKQNTENIKRIDALTKNYKVVSRLLAQKAKEDEQRSVALAKLQERIRYAPKKDDGTIAPVLHNTFLRLFQLQSTAKTGTKDNNAAQSRN